MVHLGLVPRAVLRADFYSRLPLSKSSQSRDLKQPLWLRKLADAFPPHQTLSFICVSIPSLLPWLFRPCKSRGTVSIRQLSSLRCLFCNLRPGGSQREAHCRELRAQLCRHKQGTFTRAPGNSPDVDLILSPAEATEQQKGVCAAHGYFQSSVISCLLCLSQ